MAQELETLVVRLEAQMRSYEREMNRARTVTARNMRAIEKDTVTSGQKFTAIMTNAGRTAAAGLVTGLSVLGAGGLVAGLGFSALVDTARAAAAELAKIGDVAEKVGVTAEALQALQFASEQNAGSVEAVNSGLVRFAAGLADASAGGGELYKILQANNVAFTDANGRLLPVLSLLEQFADLVKNARTPQEQLELAVRAFGRAAGPELLGMLKQGSAGLREMMQEAKDSGAVLENELIEKARRIDDQFAKIARTVGMNVKGAIVSAAASLGEFAALLDKVKGYRENLGGANVPSPEEFGLDQQIKTIQGLLARQNGRRTSITADKEAELRDLLELRKQRALKNLPAPQVQTQPALPSLVGTQPPQPAKPTILPASGDGMSKAQKEAERLAESYQQMVLVANQRIENLRLEQQTLGLTTAEAERLRFEQDLLNDAQRDGITLTDAQRATISQLAATYGTLSAALETAEEAHAKQQQMMQDFQGIATESLQGIAADIMAGVDAAEALDNALKRVAARLIDMALDQAITSLFKNMNGAGGGNFLSSIVGAITGQRASGGSVQSGGTYLVGENGPELLRMGRNGMIKPNSALGKGAGGGGLQVVVNNNANTQVSTRQTQGPQGPRLEVQIDEMVAAALMRGAKTGDALKAMRRNRMGG
ncbi:hypothetical protein [Microvirga arsenatis]|uniref:Bacteriophage tail tape measure N-terminal domain-containing protein n=1 Tax=Microvirga arsenatis TaxID=2692265 RepID=A0ABW9YUQ9_9HYPH|nr:hypothetical protein [Microvirga arsenatis]NBJ13345.1 hypothetical protein [Microvirga arsenatis]NBJ24129.1 hypothetical protein [Microvirga arsenatis]